MEGDTAKELVESLNLLDEAPSSEAVEKPRPTVTSDLFDLGLAAADVQSLGRRPRDGARYTILKPGPMHLPEKELKFQNRTYGGSTSKQRRDHGRGED